MSVELTISDEYTVTTEMLVKASGLCRITVYNHWKRYRNLPEPKRRRGVRQSLWTPTQANKWLKRIGKPETF